MARRAGTAYRNLRECRLCGHACGVNRLEEPAGVCRAGRAVRVASYGPHFGEEEPLVGRRGSGTIFFAYCNMQCVFCQNYDLSAYGHGDDITIPRLAAIMLRLQQRGCHNINLVSPTHYVPQILLAVHLAARKGLRLPLVYNTGGFDRLATLQLLDGIVDIYMPDLKYMCAQTAERLSGAPGYPAVVKKAVIEMQRQVGDLTVNRAGIATRGLLVRHLVLPEDLAGTKAAMDFLADEVSPRCFVNIMDQYRPAYRASEFPPLDRRPTTAEIETAVRAARARGLRVYR